MGIARGGERSSCHEGNARHGQFVHPEGLNTDRCGSKVKVPDGDGFFGSSDGRVRVVAHIFPRVLRLDLIPGARVAHRRSGGGERRLTDRATGDREATPGWAQTVCGSRPLSARTMSGENSGDDREQGVEFGDLDEELDTLEYPIESDELVDRYGDEELQMSDATVTVAEVLGPLDDTFHDTEEVHQAILTMVSDEAVGRKGYTDRGGETPEEAEEDEESL